MGNSQITPDSLNQSVLISLLIKRIIQIKEELNEIKPNPQQQNTRKSGFAALLTGNL